MATSAPEKMDNFLVGETSLILVVFYFFFRHLLRPLPPPDRRRFDFGDRSLTDVLPLLELELPLLVLLITLLLLLLFAFLHDGRPERLLCR